MLTLEKYIGTLLDLSDAEWASLKPCISLKSFCKGEVIARPGEVCQQALFMQRGLARGYYLDALGRDFTWSIHHNGDQPTVKNLFLVDYPSFVFQEPSQLSYEALSPVQAWAIDLPALQALLAQSERWQALVLAVSSQGHRLSYQRALSLLTEPAAERYQRLLRETPALLDLVPLRHIASYLGITPQSLSRLRRHPGAALLAAGSQAPAKQNIAL